MTEEQSISDKVGIDKHTKKLIVRQFESYAAVWTFLHFKLIHCKKFQLTFFSSISIIGYWTFVNLFQDCRAHSDSCVRKVRAGGTGLEALRDA